MGSSDPQRTGSRTVFHDDAYGNKDTNYDGYSPGFPKTLDLRYEGDLKFKGGDKMSKVVGPVEAGDMVMRASEVPVGAAALLNKMANKTQGMYKLPEEDKDMPSFMKMASKNLAQSDMTGIMAGELLRQGFDPSMIRSLDRDGIIKLYEQTFGSERDAEEMAKGPDPSDFRTILRLLQEGFSMEDIQELMSDNEEQQAKIMFPGNFTERGQNVKVLPANLKTNPDVPETSLAYITDEEAQMLKMLNPGTPHEGPEGVPTYDSLDYVAAPSTSKPKGATQSSYDRSPEKIEQKFRDQERREQQQDRRGSGEFNTQANVEQAIRDTGARAQIETDPNATGNLTELANKGLLNDVKNLVSDAGSIPGLMFKGADALADFLEARERQQVEDLFSGNVDDVAFGMGNLMYSLQNDPERAEAYFDKYEDEIDKAMGSGEKTAGGDRIGGLEGKTAQEKINAIVAKFKNNPDFQKNYNPEKFYGTQGKESTQEFQKRMQEKGVTASELAEAQKFGKIKFTRANTQMIEEGRRRLEQQNKGVDQNTGGGGGGGSAASDTPADDMPEPDERAGQFNVGGTMPYKDDVRTAGVEMDVPIGRRFNIDREGKFREPKGMDLNEALKYATMGGFQQLEPFQEYLARRKKFLGEEDPKYFDEEGNVIYGGMEA